MTMEPTPLLQRPTTWIVLGTALAGTLAGGILGLALDVQRRVQHLPTQTASAPRIAPADEARLLAADVADGVLRHPPR